MHPLHLLHQLLPRSANLRLRPKSDHLLVAKGTAWRTSWGISHHWYNRSVSSPIQPSQWQHFPSQTRTAHILLGNVSWTTQWSIEIMLNSSYFLFRIIFSLMTFLWRRTKLDRVIFGSATLFFWGCRKPESLSIAARVTESINEIENYYPWLTPKENFGFIGW